MKIKFQGWKGSFVDSYFSNLENGEWVRISLLKYITLRLKNYRVRIIFN